MRRTARLHFSAFNLIRPSSSWGPFFSCSPAGLLADLALTNHMAVQASMSCLPCWESLGLPFAEQIIFLMFLNLFFISKESKMRAGLGVLHLSHGSLHPPEIPRSGIPINQSVEILRGVRMN